MYNSAVHSDGITASYPDRQPSRMREFLPHPWLRYPYIEAGKAICVSRDGLQGQNGLPFLICYFPGPVSAPIACMNVTVNG